MMMLLDTHTLLWSLNDDKRIQNIKKWIITPKNEIYFSTASIWEIAIKYNKGLFSHPPEDILEKALDQRFWELPVHSYHTLYVNDLNYPDDKPEHKDPFDKILIAQAKYEGMVLLTADKRIANYNEPAIRYYN